MRDEILTNFWGHFDSLGQDFSDRHFERGEGPGGEVAVYNESLYYVFRAGGGGGVRGMNAEAVSISFFPRCFEPTNVCACTRYMVMRIVSLLLLWIR